MSRDFGPPTVLPDGRVCARTLTVRKPGWSDPFRSFGTHGAPAVPFFGAEEGDIVLDSIDAAPEVFCLEDRPEPFHLVTQSRRKHVLMNIPREWTELTWNLGREWGPLSLESFRGVAALDPVFARSGNRLLVTTGPERVVEIDGPSNEPCRFGRFDRCHLGFIELDPDDGLVSAGQLSFTSREGRSLPAIDGSSAVLAEGIAHIDSTALRERRMRLVSATPVACPAVTPHVYWSETGYDTWQCPAAGTMTGAAGAADLLEIRFAYARGPESSPSHLRVLLESEDGELEAILHLPCCGESDEIAVSLPPVAQLEVVGDSPVDASAHIRSTPGYAAFVAFAARPELAEFYVAASVDGTGGMNVPPGGFPFWEGAFEVDYLATSAVWAGVVSFDGSPEWGAGMHEVVLRTRIR